MSKKYALKPAFWRGLREVRIPETCAGIRCGIPYGGATVGEVHSISALGVLVRQTAGIQVRVYDVLYCVVVRCVLSSAQVSTDTLNIPPRLTAWRKKTSAG